MERQFAKPKFNIQEGQKFDASILAGGKVIETYQVLIKKILSDEVVLEEIGVPSRLLPVPKKAFITGEIGIMKFIPLDREVV